MPLGVSASIGTVGHIIYEDADAVAFLDRDPASEDHALVVPRRRAHTLLDLPRTSSDTLLTSAVIVARLLNTALDPDGPTMPPTNKAAGWQSAFHVHLHVIPRWLDDGLVIPHQPCEHPPRRYQRPDLE